MPPEDADVLQEIQDEEDNSLLTKIRHERITKIFLFAVSVTNLYACLSLIDQTMELTLSANLLSLTFGNPEQGFTDQFSFKASIFSFYISLLSFLFIHFPRYYMAGVIAIASLFETIMCWTCIQEYFQENRNLLANSSNIPQTERSGIFHTAMKVLDIAAGFLFGATKYEKAGHFEFREYQEQRRKAKMDVIICACTATVSLVTHIYILCKYSPYFANFDLEKWMEGTDDEPENPTINEKPSTPSTLLSEDQKMKKN